MLTRWFAICSLPIVLALPATSVSAEATDNKEQVIANFETALDLAQWKTSGCTAELVEEHATLGAKAVHLTYQPGAGFHTFMTERDKNNRINVSGCTNLLLDVFSPANANFTVKLKSNQSAQQWSKAFSAGPAQQQISISLADTGIDLANIDYINLFVGDNTEPVNLYVDAIRAAATAPATPAPAPKPADAASADVIISDFETPEDLARWSVNGTVTALSDEHVTHGQKSAMVTYQRGEGLHTFNLNIPRQGVDLSKCTHLMIDLYAPVNLEAVVKLKSDENKQQWQRDYSIEPSASTISIPLSQTKLDTSKIHYINIFVGAPRNDVILFVDNVRGVKMTAGAPSNLPVKKEKPDEEMF
jgi:hypothetical protein